MSKFGIGQAVRRVEDQRFTHRARAATSTTSPCRGNATASRCSRRTRMRASSASTPRRPRPRRACSACSPARMPRPTGSAALPPFFMPEDMGGPKGYRDACARCCCADKRALRRRPRRLRRGRDGGAGARRRRAGRGRLRAAAGASSIVEEAAKPGAPKVWDDNARAAMSPSRSRSATRTRPMQPSPRPSTSSRCGSTTTASPPMPSSRALRSATTMPPTTATRSIRPRRIRTAYALAARRASVSRTGDQAPRDLARRRRRLRHEGRHLSRGRAGAVGVARCGRPVKWIGDAHAKACSATHHGRDQVVHGELALDENGKILALRAQRAARGRRLFGRRVVTRRCSRCKLIPSVYDMPAMHVGDAGRCSPTRRRHRPIAAPAVRRRPT